MKFFNTTILMLIFLLTLVSNANSGTLMDAYSSGANAAYESRILRTQADYAEANAQADLYRKQLENELMRQQIIIFRYQKIILRMAEKLEQDERKLKFYQTSNNSRNN